MNAASSVATRVLQLTVLVWVNQYLLRRIDPQEYALLPVVISLIFFADVLRHTFTGGLGRYIVEADARQDDVGVTRIVSSMLPFMMMLAAVLALAVGVGAWKIDTLIMVDPRYLWDARLMLLLLVGLLCVNSVAAPFAQGPYVRQRFVALNALNLACELLRMLILVSLLVFVSVKVMWVVVASSVAGVVNLAARLIMTRRLLPAARFQKDLISGATARELIGFGAWTSLSGFSDLASNIVPALLLNRFGGAVDVAAFHLGRLPDVQIRRMMAAAMVPAQPALTSIYARDGAEPLNDLYYRGGRYHLWITLLFAAPLLLFGREIIVLYVGTPYVESASVMLALLSVYPFLWASAMFYRISHAIGSVRAYYSCTVFVQVVTLAALWYAVAVQGAGAVGASVAVAVSTGALHVVLVWPLGLRLVRGNWMAFLQQTLVPGTCPLLAAVIACLIFGTLADVNSWWTVAAVIALSTSTYLAVLLAFCLDNGDRELLGRVVRKARRVAGLPQARTAW